MRPVLVAIVTFVLSTVVAPAAALAQDAPYVLPFTNVHRFHSALNGVDYSLYVRVPPEYATTQKTYPVIYLLDADYQFALASNVIEHLADRQHQAPQAIVVAIAYSDVYPNRAGYENNRSRDYTPAHVIDGSGYSPEAEKLTGGGSQFLAVIEHEVFAYVEHTYRAEPKDRTLVGHSYGGLFASWVLQEHPALFKRYLIVSPSLWYDGQLVLRHEGERHRALAARTLVYFAIGSWENHPDQPGRQMIDHMNRFAALLNTRHDPNLVVRSRTFEDETHASIFPVAFSTGIRHLFGDMDSDAVGGD